jgi:hypothetical protein
LQKWVERIEGLPGAITRASNKSKHIRIGEGIERTKDVKGRIEEQGDQLGDGIKGTAYGLSRIE